MNVCPSLLHQDLRRAAHAVTQGCARINARLRTHGLHHARTTSPHSSPLTLSPTSMTRCCPLSTPMYTKSSAPHAHAPIFHYRSALHKTSSIHSSSSTIIIHHAMCDPLDLPSSTSAPVSPIQQASLSSNAPNPALPHLLPPQYQHTLLPLPNLCQHHNFHISYSSQYSSSQQALLRCSPPGIPSSSHGLQPQFNLPLPPLIVLLVSRRLLPSLMRSCSLV